MKIKYFTVFIFCLVGLNIFGQNDWVTNKLSQEKRNMGVVSVGSTVWFAGGEYGKNNFKTVFVDTVEVFNVHDQSIVFYKLSKARTNISAVTAGSKIIFAGGYEGFLPNGNRIGSDVIDIYDTQSKIWSVEKLSIARGEMASAVVGNKVIFAGGRSGDEASDAVDIYDITTENWSQEKLSIPTFGMAVAVAEDKVFFAGGFDANPKDNPDYFVRKYIDIYDTKTDSWSLDSLSEAKAFAGGVSSGDKLFFAGGSKGLEQSKIVDIYNWKTNVWSIDSLSEPRSFTNYNCVSLCNQVYFVGGDCINMSAFLVGIFCGYNQIDIYDNITNKWHTDTLPYVLKGHGVASVENKFVVAGGIHSVGWKLTENDEIIMKNCLSTFVEDKIELPYVNTIIYPNPSSDYFLVTLPDFMDINGLSMVVSDSKGAIKMSKTGEEIRQIHYTDDLTSGYYYVKFTNYKKSRVHKLVIVR
jgi:hypothetical protein